MKTVLYQDILNQAVEAAGRTRDKIPSKELLMIQGFVATALREVWNGQYQWPELIPAVASFPASAGSFSKNEGGSPELGDILGVWTANPQATTQFMALRFEERDGAVWLPDGGQTSVWVEYMLPCPDLNALSGSTLLNYALPSRLRGYLAWTSAGNLARADGQMSQGDEFLALAQSEIVIELRRVVQVPRRMVRMKDIYQAKPAAPAQG